MRREIDHHVLSGNRAAHALAVEKVERDRTRAGCFKLDLLGPASRGRCDGMTCLEQPRNDATADDPGCSSYQNAHLMLP